MLKHGSGAAWLDRGHPGTHPAWRPLPLAVRTARFAARAAFEAARGNREDAAFALLDLISLHAFERGRRRSNRAVG